MSILLAFFRSAAHTRARKPLGDIAFLLLARPADVAISSQPRYDHFDTAAYQIVRTQIRITVSILLAFFRSAAHTRARKPLGDIAFLLLARPADVAISSQLRYDHLDTAATGCGRVASQSHNHRID